MLRAGWGKMLYTWLARYETSELMRHKTLMQIVDITGGSHPFIGQFTTSSNQTLKFAMAPAQLMCCNAELYAALPDPHGVVFVDQASRPAAQLPDAQTSHTPSRGRASVSPGPSRDREPTRRPQSRGPQNAGHAQRPQPAREPGAPGTHDVRQLPPQNQRPRQHHRGEGFSSHGAQAVATRPQGSHGDDRAAWSNYRPASCPGSASRQRTPTRAPTSLAGFVERMDGHETRAAPGVTLERVAFRLGTVRQVPSAFQANVPALQHEDGLPCDARALHISEIDRAKHPETVESNFRQWCFDNRVCLKAVKVEHSPDRGSWCALLTFSTMDQAVAAYILFDRTREFARHAMSSRGLHAEACSSMPHGHHQDFLRRLARALAAAPVAALPPAAPAAAPAPAPAPAQPQQQQQQQQQLQEPGPQLDQLDA